MIRIDTDSYQIVGQNYGFPSKKCGMSGMSGTLSDVISKEHLCTSSSLIPKANVWIQNNLSIRLVRCETVEKKIRHIDDISNDEVMFVPKGNFAIYVKGLRYVFVLL